MKKMAVLIILVLIFFPGIVFAGNIDKGIEPGNQDACIIGQHEPYKTYFKPERPPQGSLKELYQDILMTTLLPNIQGAVTSYYVKNTGYSPSVDPWQPDILYIERPNGYRTFLFIIKLEVAPYLGAHNSIGVDRITLRVASNEVQVLDFEHIKSYPIPPWLQHHK